MAETWLLERFADASFFIHHEGHEVHEEKNLEADGQSKLRALRVLRGDLDSL